MIFKQILIFTVIAVLGGVLTACGAATEDEAATATPVSSIQGLPLPTDSTDTIVAVIVTPTPGAGGGETATTEATPEGTGEATPAATEEAADAEAGEGTAEPSGEATGQAPAEGDEASQQPATGESEGGARSQEERINQGEEVYSTQCAKCHQLSGEGSDAFPALKGSDIATAEDPSAAIETVLHGREAMPSFQGTLSPDEIAAVVSYVRNAWDNQASAVTTQQVEEVAASADESDSETAQSQ